MTFCAVFTQDEIAGYVGAHERCLSPLAGCHFDFDGDQRADIGVFRPSNGVWYVDESTRGFTATHFGLGWRQTGLGRLRWRRQVRHRGLSRRHTGTASTARGTFDGRIRPRHWPIFPYQPILTATGEADVTVFARPGTGYWYQLQTTRGFPPPWSHGAQTTSSCPADYDGDGKADVNVFRP